MVKKAPVPRTDPSKAKKKQVRPPRGGEEDSRAAAVAADRDVLRQQQRVLDSFRKAFGDELGAGDAFAAVLQEVKQALFDRDFDRAFSGRQAHEQEQEEEEGAERSELDRLAVYAARWSPTRALCYASVLGGIRGRLDPLLRRSIPGAPEGDISSVPSLKLLTVLCIGGAAAETAAFASLLSQDDSLAVRLVLLDSAPWGPVVTRLEQALTTPPASYASAVVAPASRLATLFLQRDVLEMGRAGLAKALGNGIGEDGHADAGRSVHCSPPTMPLLVTLFFTLNELFTCRGLGTTTAFLLELTAVLPAGSLLLVVDSPGSYSEVAVGLHAKRYPMQWLLDRILLGTATRDDDDTGDADDSVEGPRWRKLESHDSLWFRLPDGLNYPINLENMRYQMHLYQVEAAEETLSRS